MAWQIEKLQAAPAESPYAVVGTDGQIEGCHPTKAMARQQLAALYANEGAQTSMPPEHDEQRLRLPKENLIRAVANWPLPDADPDAGERTYLPALSMRAESTGDGETPILSGYFARFNEWTEINSLFEGHFMENVANGSFKKTFRELTPKVLFQHGMDPQVADKPLGPVRELREERDQGAYYEVPMLDTAYNRELEPGLRENLYGASFRFSVMREDIVEEPDPSDYNPKGLPERTIREARVSEFGPVTFPAYAGATAGIRSLTDEFIAARFATDSEALKRLNTFLLRFAEDDEPEQKTSERTEETPANGTTPGQRPTSRSGSRWLTPHDPTHERRWL